MSVTVTVKVQLLVLPLASVAVLVTVVVPTGNVLPLAVLVTKFVTPQLSVALAKNVTLLRLHRPGSAANTRLLEQVITGFCVSVMVTVNVQVVMLPLASVAVLVTVVVPTGNVLPLAMLLRRFVTLQLSVPLTVKVTLLRLHWPGSAGRIRLVGQVSVGFWLSVTVTVKVQELVLPLASVAVLVTVVVPTGNVLPLAMLLVTFVTRQLSVALTVKVTLLRLHRPGSAGSSRLDGHVMVAFCVSVTVTVKVQMLLLPLASVAMLVTVVTPTGNGLSLGGLLTKLVTRQLSVAPT